MFIGQKCSFISLEDNRKKINLANKLNGLKATRHYNIKDFDCTLFFLQSPSLHQSLQFSFLKAKYKVFLEHQHTRFVPEGSFLLGLCVSSFTATPHHIIPNPVIKSPSIWALHHAITQTITCAAHVMPILCFRTSSRRTWCAITASPRMTSRTLSSTAARAGSDPVF